MPTILTVDDSASVRQVVKTVLSGAGYAVIEATDGLEGLAKAKSNAINMVITDLNMPVMNGLELIRNLRKVPSIVGIPIVFLTTESDDSLKQDAKAAGATGWITKTLQAGAASRGRHQAGAEVTIDAADVYRQEAGELLDSLEGTLLDLEKTPANRDLIDTAFRALHTIKGSGAMFGFDRVAAFTHDFETAFDLVRKGKVAVTKDLLAIALDAKDHIRALIDAPEEADKLTGEAILRSLQVWSRRPPTRVPRFAPQRTPRPLRWPTRLRPSPCRPAAQAGTSP